MLEIGIEVFFKLLLVIALGGLVGFEREHRHKEAGVRTFILIAVLGFLTAHLSTVFGNLIVFITLTGSIILASLSYHDHVYRKQHIGLTTVFAMVIMFFVGIIGYLDTYPPFLTVSIGIVLALILASREYMHKFANKLKDDEILDGLVFGVLAFVILPLLPKQAIDPFGVFRPFYIWLFMVFVLGINFVSYAVMKIFGARMGLSLTGVIGGLVSSTSVTASMATKISKNRSLMSVGSFAASIASSMVFLRIPIVVFVVNPSLGLSLLIPMGIIATVGFLTSFMLLNSSNVNVKPRLGSPLEFKSALKFGLVFVFILIAVSFIQKLFGEAGVYIASLVSGLTDVDAISLSLANLTIDSLDTNTAIVGIMIAAMSNMFFKWFITRQAGGKEMFNYIAKSFIPIIVTTLVLIFMVYFKIFSLV